MKFGDRLKQIVGNRAKGRISKRMFQENKARQIFRKKRTFRDSPFCFITTKEKAQTLKKEAL